MKLAQDLFVCGPNVGHYRFVIKVGQPRIAQDPHDFLTSLLLCFWSRCKVLDQAVQYAGRRFCSCFRNGLRDRQLLPSLCHPAYCYFMTNFGGRTFSSDLYVVSAGLITYYPSDTHLIRDHKLQDWVLETIDGAQVLDFPPFPLATRDTLVSILSHIAFLTGVGHHVLNGATPGESCT